MSSPGITVVFESSLNPATQTDGFRVVSEGPVTLTGP